MANQTGRHFLQIPGPTPVPERILNAMSRQMLDHRGPTFGEFGLKLLADVKTIFKTTNPVIIYPSSGTGAWEAGFVNTLSPGDHVLIVETGQFAVLWRNMAERLGLKPEVLPTDWHGGADANAVEARLKKDKAHDIKAVCVVHNETSTGARTWIDEIRKALDGAKHPALLMVDAVSSLAAMDYRHDEWGVDVAVSGSQKGLMLPPGLSFTAVSQKALAASKKAKLTRSYWNWTTCSPSTRPARSPIRRPSVSCMGSPRRSPCCTRKVSTTCSRAMSVSPRRRAAPCAAGVSRPGAAIPVRIRRR